MCVCIESDVCVCVPTGYLAVLESALGARTLTAF